MKTIIAMITTLIALSSMAQEIDKKTMPEGLYFGITPIHGFLIEKGKSIQTTHYEDGSTHEVERNRSGLAGIQMGIEAKVAYQVNHHVNAAVYSKLAASNSSFVDVGLQLEYNPIRIIGLYARAGQSFDLDNPESDAVVMGGGINLNFPFLSNRFFMAIHLGVNYKEIEVNREDYDYGYNYYNNSYPYTTMSNTFESEQFIIDTGISLKWKLGR